MLTVRQAAEQLAVSPASVYRLVETGKLLAHRIGIGRGTIRISEEQLDAFLSSTETETPPQPSLARRERRHLQPEP